MRRLKAIVETLIDPALEDRDLVALERASTILRSVAEAERIEAELSKSARTSRSESMRYWVPILAPVITAVALVCTLVFQVQQFDVNSRLQNDVNEDTQWRTAVTYATSREGKQSVIAYTLLKSFYDSPRYSKSARETAEVLLPGSLNPVFFRTSFEDFLSRTNWENYQGLVNISRILLRFRGIEQGHIDGLANNGGQSQSKPILQGDNYDHDPAEHYAAMDDLEENIVVASAGLVRFLRDHSQTRPAGLKIDLSDTAIWHQDLSRLDFSGASMRIWIANCNLEGANLQGANLGNWWIYNSNVKDADFSGVVFDSNSETKPNWESTAWWRAKKMNPDLVRYLHSNFPYSDRTKYRDDNTTAYAQYLQEVERLNRNQ